RMADELIARVPEQALAVFVEEDHAALGVPAQHDAVGAVDDAAVGGLVGAQAGELAPAGLDPPAGRVRIPQPHEAALHHGRPAGAKAHPPDWFPSSSWGGACRAARVDAGAARPLASRPCASPAGLPW